MYGQIISLILRSIVVMAVLSCGMFHAGCVTGAGEQEWSTKSQSVLEGGPQELNVPPKRLETLDMLEADQRGYRAVAIDLLYQAAQSEHALLRAHAMEATHGAPASAEVILAGGLADTNRGVRFSAAMTIGDLKLVDLAPQVELLTEDASLSVRAAALYALTQIGQEVDLTLLAEMLFSGDPELKANAAMVLGRLGNKTAVPVLKAAIGKGLQRVDPARARVVEMQLAEALVQLGSLAELEAIHAALFAPSEQGELKALACQICGRLRDRSAFTTLMALALRTTQQQEAPEVRLLATEAIAMIEPHETPVEVAVAYLGDSEPSLRALAALSLGSSGDLSLLPQLAMLMEDENPSVQVAAATAVLRLPVPAQRLEIAVP
ncbi:MAG: HEAT repeat domain-containing protein [Phycisphaerales bacterium]|nr:HEAT repeat domain-containing protein [Phycisphaerales bacterium]